MLMNSLFHYYVELLRFIIPFFRGSQGKLDRNRLTLIELSPIVFPWIAGRLPRYKWPELSRRYRHR